MARSRNLLINIERMRREMDELVGDPWSEGRVTPRPTGFSPRVDLYICRDDRPKAVVTVELAGVPEDAISIELSRGRLVLSGQRPVRETEGRAYQQVEIPTGRFRRTIELGVEIDSEGAAATFTDGMLRIELPLRLPENTSRTVPIERTEG